MGENRYSRLMEKRLLREILKLSMDKRIQLAGDIWDSIREDDELIVLPDAHRCELDRRLDDANPAPGRSWNEVKARLLGAP